MNTNKITIYSQGILDVLYESGVSHISIKDYINMASTCWQLRQGLISDYYVHSLKNIFLISTNVFQRFVEKAKGIDRSNNPKSEQRIIFPFGDLLHGGHVAVEPDYETIELSQREYEVKGLNAAYQKRDFSFDSMSDLDRNSLLDVINEIDASELIQFHEIEAMTVGWLMKDYSLLNERHRELESIISLFNEKDIDSTSEGEKTKWGYLLILFLTIQLIVYILNKGY